MKVGKMVGVEIFHNETSSSTLLHSSIFFSGTTLPTKPHLSLLQRATVFKADIFQFNLYAYYVYAVYSRNAGLI